MEMWWLRRCGGSLVGDAVAHYGDVVAHFGDVVAHYKDVVALFRDLLAHCWRCAWWLSMEMWWLIVGDVVAH